MIKAAFVLLLAGLPLGSRAQTTTPTEAPPHGELTGARPSPIAPRPTSPPADLALQHLLQTDVDLARTAADQLPNLYERFIDTTRDERRQWTAPQWDAAGQVLARLNQRYEQVRTELSLEERLRIRALQGEFHALRSARQVKGK